MFTPQALNFKKETTHGLYTLQASISVLWSWRCIWGHKSSTL